jgi:hypothetical protein
MNRSNGESMFQARSSGRIQARQSFAFERALLHQHVPARQVDRAVPQVELRQLLVRHPFERLAERRSRDPNRR